MGSKTAVYCRQHAQDDMVNVYSKRCLHDSCIKCPSFNIRGSKTAVYCKQHAQDGMVNVCSKRCLHDSCMKRPTFNVKGSKTALYCRSHAADGLVNREVLSLEGLSTTGPKLTNASVTTRTRYTKVSLYAATNTSNSSAAVVDFRKRSMVDLDRVEPPLCSDHLTFQCREVRTNTGVDPRKDDTYAPSFIALPRLLDDDTVRTVTHQSNNGLASPLTALPDKNQPGHYIKTEMEVAVLM